MADMESPVCHVSVDPPIPEQARLHFERGMELRELHRWKRAAEEFGCARTLFPDWADAWFWEAVSLDNRGEEAKAIPLYEGAISRGLSGRWRGRAFAWLASSCSKAGNPESALKYLTDAELAGGYEPRAEFDELARQIRRRVLRKTKNRT